MLATPSPFAALISIATSNVQIDAEYGRLHAGAPAGAYVMVSVGDTGSGMTPEVQERIFEPILHHEGARSRHRARPVNGLRDHQTIRWLRVVR